MHWEGSPLRAALHAATVVVSMVMRFRGIA